MDPIFINAKESPDDAGWLQDHFKQYLIELAQYDPGYERIIKWAEMSPEAVRLWYFQDNLCPLVIKHEGERVGFAFVARSPFPFVTPGVEYRMGEFYIVAHCRRRGLGRLAALSLFSHRPGSWEVMEIPKNQPAVRFWIHTIREATGGRFEDAISEGRRRQCFIVRPEQDGLLAG